MTISEVFIPPACIPTTVEDAWMFYAKATRTDPNDRKAYHAFLSGASWAAAHLFNTVEDPADFSDEVDKITDHQARVI